MLESADAQRGGGADVTRVTARGGEASNATRRPGIGMTAQKWTAVVAAPRDPKGAGGSRCRGRCRDDPPVRTFVSEKNK